MRVPPPLPGLVQAVGDASQRASERQVALNALRLSQPLADGPRPLPLATNAVLIGQSCRAPSSAVRQAYQS